MNIKEKKYLEDRLVMVEAAIRGAILGLLMFGPTKGESQGDTVIRTTDVAMSLVRKDIERVYKQGKRVGRTAPKNK